MELLLNGQIQQLEEVNKLRKIKLKEMVMN
jgi:hypothetical protein